MIYKPQKKSQTTRLMMLKLYHLTYITNNAKMKVAMETMLFYYLYNLHRHKKANFSWRNWCYESVN